MLYPDVLGKEWPKHRERVRTKRLNELSPDQKAINIKKSIKDPVADLTAEQLKNFKAVYNSQFDKIDTLLRNGIAIQRTNELT